MASRKTAEEKRAEGEQKVLETLAGMSAADRKLGERLHAVITTAAPELEPRLWYSQPAYAKDGKVVVFFRGADVDGERYLSLGFSEHAALDDGNVWPTAYAVTDLTESDEKTIAALVERAVG